LAGHDAEIVLAPRIAGKPIEVFDALIAATAFFMTPLLKNVRMRCTAHRGRDGAAS
jgi:hypothetical protein